MKSLLLILTIVSLLYACKQKVTEEPIPVTPFNLQTDYLNFTEKLNVGDTLELGFNLSVCTGQEFVTLTIIREIEQFKLLTEVEDLFSDTLFMNRFPIEDFKLDSLLQEEVFLDKFPIIEIDTGINYSKCFMVYQRDTMRFQQKERSHLGSQLDFIGYFHKVMRNYYPSSYYFRAFLAPPPPPLPPLPPTEVND